MFDFEEKPGIGYDKRLIRQLRSLRQSLVDISFNCDFRLHVLCSDERSGNATGVKSENLLSIL